MRHKTSSFSSASNGVCMYMYVTHTHFASDNLIWRWIYLANTAEDKRLSLIIPVGSHSQVHLLGVCVLLEGFSHPQDGIRGTHLHSTPPGAAPKQMSIVLRLWSQTNTNASLKRGKLLLRYHYLVQFNACSLPTDCRCKLAVS